MGLMAPLESGIDWSLEVFSINGTDSVIDSCLWTNGAICQ